MTRRVLLLLLLVAVNAGLLWSWKRLAVERDELTEARIDFRRRGQANLEAREHERRISDLKKRLSSPSVENLDIALFRDRLIGAERGLDLDRISLDFRPDPNPSAGLSRGRIEASLNGSFDALYEYLRRVEALRLPLRPDELSLRPDSTSDKILLSVSWTALWGGGAGDRDDFSDDEVARLERWLARKQSLPPQRDPFFSHHLAETGPASMPAVEHPSVGRSEGEPASKDVVDSPGTPTLTGFVLSRPELEKDLSRRVLAAVRFEGELRLVKIGDVVGPFRVERIDARERVVLVDRTTGERLQLFLQ